MVDGLGVSDEEDEEDDEVDVSDDPWPLDADDEDPWSADDDDDPSSADADDDDPDEEPDSPPPDEPSLPASFAAALAAALVLLDAPRSFFAQPDPLKWIAGAPNCLRIDPSAPQLGQNSGPGSLIPCRMSARWSQAEQR